MSKKRTSTEPATTRASSSATPQSQSASTTLIARWPLTLWITLYVLLTGALIARVPQNATPDEAPHLAYVQFVAERHALPVFQVLPQQDNPGYEYHQPPLYYVLCAPAYKVLPAGVQNYFCRVVSLLCGALILWLLWQTTCLLFPHNTLLPSLATGFATLWPMHQAVGVSTGNDALAGLICAAHFWMIARLARKNIVWMDVVWLGVLIGLGILTKTTCLIASLVALGALAHFVWLQSKPQTPSADAATDDSSAPSSTLQPYPAVALAVVVALVLGGWWLVRNRFLYGDPFAQGAFNRAFAFNLQTAKGSPGLTEFLMMGISTSQYIQGLLLSLFWTCWGFWGGPESARQVVNVFNRNPINWSLFTPVIPLVLICLLSTVLSMGGFWRWSRHENEDVLQTWVIRWWAIALLLVSVAWVMFSVRYMAGGQARYFHPVLVPLCVFGATGWQQVFSGPRSAKLLPLATGLFAGTLLTLTAWNILSWKTLV